MQNAESRIEIECKAKWIRQTKPAGYTPAMKIVGHRRRSDDTAPLPPADALRRACVLQAQMELLNPYARPRGFVFKARTHEEYERWRKAQPNPRLW
ncbi:MAG: hypothetical protein HY674_12695 [Chloroflexi bacterium]|nr:hypothetical protein [Chloroflexota bacterium]